MFVPSVQYVYECVRVCVCGHKEQTTWNILVGYSNLITMLLSTQKRDTQKTREKEGGNTAEKKEGGALDTVELKA